MRKRLRLFTPTQRLAQNVSAVTLIDKIWLSTSSGMTPPGPFLARQPGREALSAAVSLKSYSCSLLSHGAPPDEFQSACDSLGEVAFCLCRLSNWSKGNSLSRFCVMFSPFQQQLLP